MSCSVRQPSRRLVLPHPDRKHRRAIIRRRPLRQARPLSKAASPQPIRDALSAAHKSSVTAPELGRQNRSVSTDLDGHYEIKDLPAARYTLTVTRNGYLRLRYGQRQALEQGKPLEVAAGQVVQNIDFALPKMSTIAGRVTDELGDPIEGANVFAMRLEYFNGRRRIVPTSQAARTDDVGQYRLTGLMPGTYFVQAKIRETWTVIENGKTEQLGYAPTFLPGLTNVSDATRVTVGIGQQINVQDFSLIPGRAAKISGIALDAMGRPLAGGSVSLSDETVGPGIGMFMSAGSGPIAADGTFAIPNVQPGEYRLRARPNPQSGAKPEILTQVLTVDGRDVDGLHLITTAGWSMSGRIRTESGEPPTADRNRINLTAPLVSPDMEPRSVGFDTTSQIRDDWTFTIATLFGPSRLQVTTPVGWALKSVMRGDQDVSDAPLDMQSGEELSGLEIVLTNRVTRVPARLPIRRTRWRMAR